MSNRIKELMDEAVRFRLDPDSNEYEAQVSPEDLQVFAELIVQECADLFEGLFTDEQYQRRIDKTIKVHFGVYE